MDAGWARENSAHKPPQSLLLAAQSRREEKKIKALALIDSHKLPPPIAGRNWTRQRCESRLINDPPAGVAHAHGQSVQSLRAPFGRGRRPRKVNVDKYPYFIIVTIRRPLLSGGQLPVRSCIVQPKQRQKHTEMRKAGRPAGQQWRLRLCLHARASCAWRPLSGITIAPSAPALEALPKRRNSCSTEATFSLLCSRRLSKKT